MRESTLGTSSLRRVIRSTSAFPIHKKQQQVNTVVPMISSTAHECEVRWGWKINSCTLINFELVQFLTTVNETFSSFHRQSTLVNIQILVCPPGHESWENSHANYRFSTIVNSCATLVLVWPGHESWENSHANYRFSAIMNSRATLVLVWPGHESWESSHANSCFSTLINSHANLVLVWPGHESWENSHANSRFSTLINSHATLVLVWPGHESWENSHANSHFSTLMQQPLFSFDRDMRVEKTGMQTLACQLSSTLIFILTYIA
jgi:hypothetical protein